MKRRRHSGCSDRLLSSCGLRTLSRTKKLMGPAAVKKKSLRQWAPKLDRYIVETIRQQDAVPLTCMQGGSLQQVSKVQLLS